MIIVVVQLVLAGFVSPVHGSSHDSAHSQHASQQSIEQANSHHLLHHIGQPHEHHTEHPEYFKISYSDAAFEHSNPHHDRGLPVLATLTLPLVMAAPAIFQRTALSQSWLAPILSDQKPPPRQYL
ncbi:hypothetical protein [Pseudidiomarina mangrovi]|uniref:hypothetical protein n=1 Tax=Pseudidiomarina mangrovi TaxID=2487133 RepID=UPI000FCB9D7B|nr:hypothetical protein [Pseudidiomarina mangrovi]